jgi:iron complex outermembrane receptor protein
VGNVEKKENFWLLNLAATYAITDNVSLWARGENLLAQRYEINLGYPMPRATFMGGVNIHF